MFRLLLAATTVALLAGAAAVPAGHPHAPAPTAGQAALERTALRIAAKHRGTPKRVVADYTSDSDAAGYTPDRIPFGEMTDLIHAGVPYDASGHLAVPAGFLDHDLIRRAHRAHVKVLLLVSGAIDGFTDHPGAVARAVVETRRVVKANGYDGVDLDWEFPATAAQTKVEVALLHGFRAALGRSALLSIDVAPWTLDSYAIPRIAHTVDWFNLMTYDCAGPWTAHAQPNAPILPVPSDPVSDECTPGQSDAEATALLLQAGARPGQINQGTPFYAYEYTSAVGLWGACPEAATSDDGTCGDAAVPTLTYAQVEPLIGHGWTRHVDPEGLVPYLTRDGGRPGFITYDDARSTYDRVLYSAWTRHLGGTFLWSLGDDATPHGQPLLAAMARASRGLPLP